MQTIACDTECEVIANRALCREHVAIDALAPTLPASAPGQFLQLLCRDADDVEAHAVDWPEGGAPSLSDPEWTRRSAYLRRPFSIADRWEDASGRTCISVISRNVGVGTAWLERLRPGQTLNVTGPLGRGFRVEPAGSPLVLVGGGVGIPPLLYLARELRRQGRDDVLLILGATTRDLLPVPMLAEAPRDAEPSPCLELPGGARYPALVTTDDGTLGIAGRVTDALTRWLTARARSASTPEVLACGPEGMLRALARLTREHGLACQLCIEKPMGCGLGTCLSCVVRVNDAGRQGGWRWALACLEGPVFERDRLQGW